MVNECISYSIDKVRGEYPGVSMKQVTTGSPVIPMLKTCPAITTQEKLGRCPDVAKSWIISQLR